MKNQPQPTAEGSSDQAGRKYIDQFLGPNADLLLTRYGVSYIDPRYTTFETAGTYKVVDGKTPKGKAVFPEDDPSCLTQAAKLVLVYRDTQNLPYKKLLQFLKCNGNLLVVSEQERPDADHDMWRFEIADFRRGSYADPRTGEPLLVMASDPWYVHDTDALSARKETVHLLDAVEWYHHVAEGEFTPLRTIIHGQDRRRFGIDGDWPRNSYPFFYDGFGLADLLRFNGLHDRTERHIQLQERRGTYDPVVAGQLKTLVGINAHMLEAEKVQAGRYVAVNQSS